MLKITGAWTNRDRPYGKAGGYGYAVSLHVVDSTGGPWWLIAGIGGRDLGITSCTIIRAATLDGTPGELDEDDEADPESWHQIELVEALAVIREEHQKAQGAMWSREYADHFALVSREYDLLQRMISGDEPIRKYERFADPL
jgi:hypothetical protein